MPDTSTTPPLVGKTREQVASEFGIPESTLRDMEARFKARLAAAILKDPESPRHLIRIALRFLNPEQP